MSIRTSFLLGALALGLACASAPKLWDPYPGCTPKQCRTWADECAAQCINKGNSSTEQCNATCEQKVPGCESSCPG